MIADRWKRLESMFQSALEREPSERDSYLEEACGGDRELFGEMKSLLAGSEETGFLKNGVVTLAMRAIEVRAEFKTGDRLGPYEIETYIASGGMGSVYRAFDTRLRRQVAIKVLRLGSSGNLWRALMRREAESAAKLQHPNICALHDVGEQDGRDFLVMEYLAGETLAQRLARGPLPLDLAFSYAEQIAAALDQAHRRDIVHRDLKPSNVMVTKIGVKLLDFGLASLRRPHVENGMEKDATDFTLTGAVAGTLPYMAPEQMNGEPTDSRTDIFAFGLILHEMLSGKRAFPQSDRHELMDAIQNGTPSAFLQIPPGLSRLIRVCLAKEPDERWQSAGDLKRELAWMAGGEAAAPKPNWRRSLAAASVTAVVCAILAGWAGYRIHTAPNPKSVRFTVFPPPGTKFPSYVDFALSPNGEQLVFTAVGADGKIALWIRALSEVGARVVPGSEGARDPFWSPDSRTIAFFGSGRLSRVDALGGPVRTICDVPNGRFGAWGPDGTILFNPTITGPLFRVSASGGRSLQTSNIELSREEHSHIWPSFLPDGRHFLYTAISNRKESTGELFVGSLDDKVVTPIRKASGRTCFRGGRLYFFDRGFKSQSFDPKQMRLIGEPSSINETNVGSFDIAAMGTLVYRGSSAGGRRDLTWVDRSGKPLSDPLTSGTVRTGAISADGKRVAFVSDSEGTRHISLLKLPSLVSTRLTQNVARDWGPVWSPDGRQIAYGSERNGHDDIFLRSSNGSGEERLLFHSDTDKLPHSWSADGRYVAVTEWSGIKYNIWIVPVADPDKKFLFLNTRHSISWGVFSPDGHWLAYWTDEFGKQEVCVSRFPEGTDQRRVSSGGGQAPQWRKDGRELYYMSNQNRMVAVPILRQGVDLQFGRPESLFEAPAFDGGEPFSTRDGQRFLTTLNPDAAQPRPIVVVLNARTM